MSEQQRQVTRTREERKALEKQARGNCKAAWGDRHTCADLALPREALCVSCRARYDLKEV